MIYCSTKTPLHNENPLISPERRMDIAEFDAQRDSKNFILVFRGGMTRLSAQLCIKSLVSEIYSQGWPRFDGLP